MTILNTLVNLNYNTVGKMENVFRMTHNAYRILVLFCTICSCSHGHLPEDKKNGTTNMDMASFSSRAELSEALVALDSYTKGDTALYLPVLPEENLFVPLDEIAYVEDPVLQVECQFIDESVLISDEVCVYDALGYDELIPNKNLARMMNARAEIMVQDTVYKVSPRGTYFFPKEYLSTFEENYASMESQEGQLVSENLYQLSEHVFRYDTFDSDVYEDYDFIELENPLDTISTKGPIIAWGNQINWSQYPRVNISAQTWIGKLFESLIGRNKSFTYNYSGNRKRLKTKFYYYNYIFFSESGVYTKTEERAFLGWKKTTCSKMCTGWSNIVYEMTIPASSPLGLGGVSPQEKYVASLTEPVPWTGQNGKAIYIFDKSISLSQINNWMKLPTNTFLNTLKARTGHDMSGTKVVKFFVDSKIVCVILGWYVEDSNVQEQQYKFYSNINVGISNINLLQLPTTWAQWAASVIQGTMNLPKFKLQSGEVRTAAQCDGEIKAVSLYKVSQ